MIVTVTRLEEIEKVVSVRCDRCGKVIAADNYTEFQEILYIRLLGGYGSVFGDGTEVEVDLCQCCVKALIGPYCRTKNELFSDAS